MENVLLTVHLILAVLLIGVVLLQRNEGGALLSGGGAMTARGTANALTKLTWIFAAAFIATSLTLYVVAAKKAEGTSVLDAVTEAPGETTDPAVPPAPEGDLLPPAPAGEVPAEGSGTTAPSN